MSVIFEGLGYRWRAFFVFSLFLLCFPLSTKATHIVGGSLTYVHNGGSSYTVTLKLYRDCGPGTAAFPGNVTVVVEGNNGATFNPTKDITMSLGTVTPVPAVLDPCAIPPNPMPCVEEGIYTTTVNNLPPNPGGYHMYYQIIARNLTIVNVDATCNCIGETFYAYIPGTASIWFEDFTFLNGTNIDVGPTAWSVVNGVPPVNAAVVDNNRFRFRGANNGTADWISEVINIGAYPGGVSLTADVSENGNFEAADNISIMYSLDGGPLTPFATNGSIFNDFGAVVAQQNGLIGTTVQIVARATYSGNSPNNERYRIDNVSVFGSGAPPNSNPEFNLLPPLFLCVNEPFTFDHSATDLDGDSLVYSFYTPYDGDNGAGPLDPTYVGNVANFTPVIWQPGFSATNPLGGPPLVLDPNTGMLSGTPTMLGQFVLGIKVEEYRNGVYLSETLRDFQFNIVNCPPPILPVAGTDVIINDGCVDTLMASGYQQNTVTWTSIFPGAAGTYDGYLSCTSNCLDPIVTPTGTPPPYVDYMICGNATACGGAFVCDTVRATFNPSLGVTIVPQNPTICFGQTNITLTAMPSGGTPPYSYLWNNVNPSQTNIVGAGTYTVELSDSSGCPPVYATVVVTAFAVPISADAGPDQTVCNQNPVVTLNGVVAGASGGQWFGGAGTFSPNDSTLVNVNYIPTAAEIASGSIDLFLATTGNGTCPPDTDMVTITFEGFTAAVTMSQTNVTCFGDNDGTATATVTGGYPPFTYLWNDAGAQTTATATGLAPGTYTVTITSAIGCDSSFSVTVTQPPPFALNSVVTNVSCNGGSDGQIDITPVGGTPPYTYLWAPGGQTTASITGQPAGTYDVTVTDANGCVETLTETITEPAPLAVTFTQTNVSCNAGTDGTATANVTGGATPYTYSWSPSGGTAQTATGLSATTYTVTVTDDNGCTVSGSVTLTEPTPIITTTTSTDETCTNWNDGTATVSATGGAGGYTYLWTPGGMTTDTVTNLFTYNYSVTVTDANGCSVTDFALVLEPPLLVPTASSLDVSCNGGNDGQATGGITGGVPPYSYSWSPGGQTTPTISGLTAGNYTVTITDANGCFVSATTTVSQPAAPLAATSVITDASCNGAADGGIATTITGGTSPYTYQWLPGGQTTSTITGQPAGAYTLTVTDSLGCVLTVNETIAEPAPIAITFTQTNVSCFGLSDGVANSTVTGGTAPYTYSWSPVGGGGPNATNLSAGTYTLTVTDNNGCVASNTVTITEPTVLLVSTSATDESCDYADDGMVTATPSGGTAPYTYVWVPGGATTATVGPLPAGAYTVTVTDFNGCTENSTATINEPAPLAITFTNQSNVSCNGGADGAVSASVTGGNLSYAYSWAPGGQTTNSISGLTAGTYTLTITDLNGCTETASVTITEPTQLTVSTVVTNVSCNGGSDGTITATPAGGTAGYTYLWLPGGQTTSSIIGQPAGNYSVTVTDANGCSVTENTVIAEPAALDIAFSQTNITCFGGNDGVANSMVTGGTPAYSYSWTPSGGTGPSETGLTAGTYVLTVTDALGCVATGSVTLIEPTEIIVNASATDETCDYSDDGTATASPTGGTGGYTYLWMPGSITTQTITGLTNGSYTVTVTDISGCTATETVTVNEPATLSIAFSGQVNVACNGDGTGAVTATGSGGTPNYTYAWAPGGQTTNSISGLTAGTYTVTMTDANGCVETNSVTITEPPVLSVGVAATNVSCYGGSNGTVTGTASGGVGPYTYVWQPGNMTGSNITNLPAGTYSVTATDQNGCSATNTVGVLEPGEIILSTSSINSTCGLANGSASVSVVSGGVGPFSYSWAPSGGTGTVENNLLSGIYTITVTDNNGCIATADVSVNDNAAAVSSITASTNISCNGGADGSATVTPVGGTPPFTYLWTPSGQTTQTATGLSAGTHSVTVTESNGCVSSATVILTEPPALSVSVTTTDVNCNGGNDGTGTSAVSGGTPGYTYLWNPGGQTTPTVNNLSAGAQSLQVTDNNGCVEVFNFTINEPAAPLAVVTNGTDVSCFGGSDGTAGAVASGGTGPYAYNWMPGNINGANISGLPIGIYTVTVTDNNGCTVNGVVNINEPSDIVLTPGSVPSTCGNANGQASISAAGGTPGYTYLWAPGGQTTAVATGLLAGTYTVTVTDNNGCTDSETIVVVDTPGPDGTVTATTNVSCNGGNDGTATVTVTSGTAPFTYVWTPLGGTNATATGLSAGTYSVVITDNNGCVSAPIVSPVITEPAPIVIVVPTTDVSCLGGSDGAATTVVNGGTPGYTYLWTPGGSTAPNVSGLSAGAGSVQVTDANGCVANQAFTINEPATAVSVTTGSTDVSCFGGSDGSASATAAGGIGPYTYNWMPGNINGQNIGGLLMGAYTVTVTDNNGCTASAVVNVNQPAALALTPSSVNSTCGNANGQASVAVVGGTPGYTYFWTPGGQTGATATGLLAGNYDVLVTDNNGCTATAMVTVNNTDGPTASVTATTNVSCNGGADGTATVTPVGGTPPYTYLWTPGGQTTATATGLTAGTYTVVVTDNNGCQSNVAVSPAITQPNPIVISVMPNDVSCFGGSDGSASATAVGGTPGYSILWLPSNTPGAVINGLSAGTESVQVTDLNGCVQTANFSVNEPPQLTAGIASSTNVSCLGGSDGTATVLAGGGTPFYTYSWSPSGGTGLTANGLAPGNYTVTVSDLNGCTANANVTITEPATAVSATVSQIPNSCFGGTNGSATVNPTGGTPGYTYLWTPGGGTNQTEAGLAAGTYIVTVTDLNGCQADVAIDVLEPPGMTGTLNVTDPSCGLANGVINTGISGGTPPYTYLWTPGGTTNASATGLLPGLHQVDVTDANGCTLTLDTTLVNQPGQTVAITGFTQPSCFGGNDGTATATVVGGVPPYTYQWLPFGGNTAIATGLSAGSYTVSVTDNVGCVVTESVTIFEPTQVAATAASVTNVSCLGGADASITAAGTGGTPPYTYNWAPIVSTNATVNNLSAGTYIVTVTDANGCSSTISIPVTEPSALLVSAGALIDPTCNQTSDGSASVIVSGGTAPYSYLWSDGQTGSTAYNLMGGTYTVVVTDANGCTSNASVTLTAPTPVITIAGPNDTICNGTQATLTATATGGAGNYSFAWQPGGQVNAGTLNPSPTSNTVYTVVAYDQNGCPGTVDTIEVIVFDLTPANIDAIASLSPLCPGQSSDISAIATGIHPDDALTYTWNQGLPNGPGPHTVTPGVPTTYVVTVTNSCGTSVQDSVSVIFNPPPTLDISVSSDSACAPAEIQFFDNSVSGNFTDQIHQWFWDFGDGNFSQLQNPVHVYENPGTYNVTLTVITGNGCTNDNTANPLVINVFPSPEALFTVNSNVLDLPYDVLECTNLTTGATDYIWDFGDGNTSTEVNPNYLYTTVGDYMVELLAINQYGCTDTAYTEVTTDADLVFPNAFTPGAPSGGYYDITSLDNDIFFPYTSGVVHYHLQIFNRWGELIFETDDIHQGWDGYYRGILSPQGVYVWKAQARLNNGKEYNLVGDVTLLR